VLRGQLSSRPPPRLKITDDTATSPPGWPGWMEWRAQYRPEEGPAAFRRPSSSPSC
jgi:hypothetical protein